MKSVTVGKYILDYEVTNISQHGFWVYYFGNEYYVPFSHFPWFRESKISDILNLKADRNGNLYWPDLDVDLSIKIIENPENYPLVSKIN